MISYISYKEYMMKSLIVRKQVLQMNNGPYISPGNNCGLSN